MESRQEEVPLVEKYINCAKAEPLHLKNNTVKELFHKLMKISISSSNLSGCKSFKSISESSLFYKFVTFIRSKMFCNYLSNKIIRWYNEKCGKVEQEFSFRFRGKESKAYLHYFPELISMMMLHITPQNNSIYKKLHLIYHASILIRRLVSYSVRIKSFDAKMLEEMIIVGRQLFCQTALFENSISPSLWVLCLVAPFHASLTFSMYGFGLGCNTMEGREQKHQKIAKYTENTTFQNRWPRIFRHEYIELVYLRENGFDLLQYRKRQTRYIPESDTSFCQQCCYKKLNEANKCSICDSTYMSDILKAIPS